MNELSGDVGPSSRPPAPAAPAMTEEEALEAAMNGEETQRSRATHTSGGYKKRRSHLVRAEPQGKQDKRKKARLEAVAAGDGDAGNAAGAPSKEGTEGDAKEANEGEVKLPKYKVALLLGFNGQGYNGMQ